MDWLRGLAEILSCPHLEDGGQYILSYRLVGRVKEDNESAWFVASSRPQKMLAPFPTQLL